MEKGIMKVYKISVDLPVQILLSTNPISLQEFHEDLKDLLLLAGNNEIFLTFCQQRLKYLSSKYQLHILLNEFQESMEQKSVSHRDFYNVRKVDNRVLAASCMNQKHFLRFMKKSLRFHSEKQVYLNDKTKSTLNMKQLFETIGVNTYDLNIDKLDIKKHCSTIDYSNKFQFEKNLPRHSPLHNVFLETDNFNEGQYFGEVIKEVMKEIEDSKYQNAEFRLLLNGKNIKEWDKLAKWALEHEVYSDHIRWLIHLPQHYHLHRANHSVYCFQDYLKNIFQPLFEVTMNPQSHEQLHALLTYVTGFDTTNTATDYVGQMDLIDIDLDIKQPDEYFDKDNPPYSYYLYYIYANITVLNKLRKQQGLNTFSLRPHYNETATISHLLTAFLLAESISYGQMMIKSPLVEYLYYLCQIGISVSPIGSNSLHSSSYHGNALPDYHARGLLVSLCTDEPLLFHFTKEPLMEEYSIAAQVWKLSSTDMCELARNSVLISGFSSTVKSHWLGPQYEEEGIYGNDIHRSNVPDIRIAYRYETLTQELHKLVHNNELNF